MFVKAGKHLVRLTDITSVFHETKSIINISEGKLIGELKDKGETFSRDLEVHVTSDNPKDGFVVNFREEPFRIYLTLEEGEKLIHYLIEMGFRT